MTTFAYNLTLNVEESEFLKYLLEGALKRCKEIRKVSPKGGPHVPILYGTQRILEKMNSSEYSYKLYLPEGEGITLRSVLNDVTQLYGNRYGFCPAVDSSPGARED